MEEPLELNVPAMSGLGNSGRDIVLGGNSNRTSWYWGRACWRCLSTDRSVSRCLTLGRIRHRARICCCTQNKTLVRKFHTSFVSNTTLSPLNFFSLYIWGTQWSVKVAIAIVGVRFWISYCPMCVLRVRKYRDVSNARKAAFSLLLSRSLPPELASEK